MMEKSKIITVEEAVKKIKDGSIIHFAGFYSVGTSEEVITEILKQGQKDLTIINNDSGTPIEGVGRLVVAGRVKKLITSWCGLLKCIPQMIENKEIEVEFNPQGTLAERIRAAGYGLGGILTKTGLGTIVEDTIGKRVTIDGEDWLFHKPLRADFAVLEAYEGDEIGNLVFNNTQANFNTVMAYAADYVIASIETKIKKKGEIEPSRVMVQSPLVDAIILKGEVNNGL